MDKQNIFLTGASGFLGTRLLRYFNSAYNIKFYLRGTKLEFSSDFIVHLAGQAHDLKNLSKVEDYYSSNTELTKLIFDKFIASSASVFIATSSVKAVADSIDIPLTEGVEPLPQTHYGKSKLLAEYYINSKKIPAGKRVYILRPCMIHGPGNKGNLNLLYKLAKWGLPWPLAAFENKRSFCSVENICFVINELITRDDIPSGIYNVADDEPLSTNEVIEILAESMGKKPRFWQIPRFVIHMIARLGDMIHLPLNTERLTKLTESYVVSNKKLVDALGKSLPVKSKDGLKLTFESFK